ncbi:unnamed protein product, partial [marine sediment metagenome]
GGSEGIGNYGLMGGGSWTFSHMTAWSKIQLGWITPTFVAPLDGYEPVSDAETNPVAYILVDPGHSTDEYFLVENRHPANSYYESVGPPVAPSGTYPDSGIVIYHIDEAKIQDWINFGTNNVNNDEAHKGVDVECADSPSSHFANADDLDAQVNRGDAFDLWDEGEYDFNDTSAPCDANWYDGTNSGMDVSDFPAISPTMWVYFSLPTTPTHTLTTSHIGGGLVTDPGEGPFTYHVGRVVPLKAQPMLPGWEFYDWVGDVGTVADVYAADTTVTVNGDYSISARFVLAPEVDTLPATDIQPFQAVLNLDLVDMGSASAVDVYFEYGLDTTYGSTTPAHQMFSTGSWSNTIIGLTDGVTYHYRAVADGGIHGIDYGADMTFTTPLVVEIDINPCRYPNYIRPYGRFVAPYIQVAIPTTSIAQSEPVDFNAWDVDPSTIRFGPGNAQPISWYLFDLRCNRDFDRDLILTFRVADIGLMPG